MTIRLLLATLTERECVCHLVQVGGAVVQLTNSDKDRVTEITANNQDINLTNFSENLPGEGRGRPGRHSYQLLSDVLSRSGYLITRSESPSLTNPTITKQ